MSIEMGVEPDEPQRRSPGRACDAAPRADRDGMIAAEDQRNFALYDAPLDRVGERPCVPLDQTEDFGRRRGGTATSPVALGLDHRCPVRGDAHFIEAFSQAQLTQPFRTFLGRAIARSPPGGRADQGYPPHRTTPLSRRRGDHRPLS